MAKIEDIKLIAAETDLTVKNLPLKMSVGTSLSFHPLDLKGRMEYQLHLFIIHACTDLGTFNINYNWDEAQLFSNNQDKEDLLLHLQVSVLVSDAEAVTRTIWTTFSLDKPPACGIKVMGKLIPVFSQATKMSHNYIFDLHLK